MNLNYKEPKYDADCELLEVCKALGATYNICYKGALLSLDRCSPSQKQTMLHDLFVDRGFSYSLLLFSVQRSQK